MNEDLKRWDESAEEWVKHKESRHKFKPYLIKAGIDSLMPDIQNKLVLDAGCGDGVYSKYLFESKARVIGVDGSPQMIDLAKRLNSGPEYQVCDLTQNWPFENQVFDYIFCCMVLMQLADLENFLLESKRTLKTKGSLVFSVSHPAFTEPVMKLYKNIWDKITLKQPNGLVYNYFQKHVKERAWSRGSAKNRSFYPRTLQEYSKSLKSAGFVIQEIMEPNHLPTEFLQNEPQYEYSTRLPRFLFIKAIQQ